MRIISDHNRIFSVPIRLRVRSQQNFFCSQQTASPFAAGFSLIASGFIPAPGNHSYKPWRIAAEETQENTDAGPNLEFGPA